MRFWRKPENIRYQSFFVYYFFASFPILATIPGGLLNGGAFNHLSVHEYSVHILCVLWGALLLASLRDKDSIACFFRIVSIVVVYMLVIAIFQRLGFKPLLRLSINFFEASWIDWEIPFSGIENRTTGTTGHPNYLAGINIQLLPVFIALAMISKTSGLKRSAAYYSVIVLSLVYLCILTNSRGALISLTLSLSFFFLFLSRSKLVRFKLIHLAILSGLILAFAVYFRGNDVWVHRLATTGLDGSSLARIHIWKAALNSISDAPLFGYGTGTSYALFFSYADPEIRLHTGRSFVHAHNDIIEILQEGGLLGLIVYLVFWIGTFVFAFRFMRNNDEAKSTKILVLGLLAGLLAIHVQGMVSVAPRMVVVRVVTHSLLACLFFLVFKPKIFLDKYPLAGLIHNKRWLFSSLVILPLGVLTYFVSLYAHGQWNHAITIATTENTPHLVIAAAETAKYPDVFLLDRAIDVAQRENLYPQALNFSETLKKEVAHYRDVDFEYAFSLFKLGKTSQAFQAAKKAYEVDRYYLQNLQLLMFLAQKYQANSELKQYAADLLRLQLCRSKVFECQEAIAGALSNGNVIRYSENGNRYLIDASALFKITSGNEQGAEKISFKNSNEVIAALSSSTFFQMESSSFASEYDRDVLVRLLEQSKQISQLEKEQSKRAIYSGNGLLADRETYERIFDGMQNEIELLAKGASELKQMLPDDFDFELFQARRELVIEFTVDYTSATQFDKLAPK
jgi:O-antigen ligase